MKKVWVIGGAFAVWLATCGLMVGSAQNQSAQSNKPQFGDGDHDFDHGGLSPNPNGSGAASRSTPFSSTLRQGSQVAAWQLHVNTGGSQRLSHQPSICSRR